MCTLSFLRLSSGYSLMMNRDESPLRPQSDELRQVALGQMGNALYPVDPVSQGTWIGVNDRGLAFALMNQYPSGYQFRPGSPSRGRLIPEALFGRSAGGGLERVAAMELLQTPPFQLLGFEDGHAPLAILWDGSHLERRLYPDGALQLSVSPINDKQALLTREAQFDLMLQEHKGGAEAELLALQEGYHSSVPDLTHVLVLPKHSVVRYRASTPRFPQLEGLMQVLPRTQ